MALVELSDDFKNRLIKGYKTDQTWLNISDILDK